MVGQCSGEGLAGALALLGALERTPLVCTELTPLPALGGFLSSHWGACWGGHPLALMISGQLMPADGQAIHGPGRVVCRIGVRSASAAAIWAIQAQPAVWLKVGRILEFELVGGSRVGGRCMEWLEDRSDSF